MNNSSLDLEQLNKKCFENHELVTSLLGRFMNSISDYEYEIAEVYDSEDLAIMSTIAHRLAGESGTMCAWQLHETAKRICVACKNDSLESFDELLDQLAIDITNVREFLARMHQDELQRADHEICNSAFQLTGDDQ